VGARIVLAVSLLVGFYLLAIGIIAGLIALIVVLVLSGDPTGSAVPVAIFAEAMIVVVAIAFGLSLRERVRPAGVALTEADAPELWNLVRELASRAEVRPPDQIRLIAEANAWVFDDAAFWGLRPGRRLLDVGMPLLLGMRTDQLTAVLAHELAHYSRRDTRLYGIVYRGRETIADTIDGLPRSPWRALLRGYFWLYWSVSAVVLRRQEAAADRFAAEATDGPTVADALRELNAIDRAWTEYLDGWVAVHVRSESAPDNICGDFGEFLAAGAVDLARSRAVLPDRWDSSDTHPPLAERVAMMERLPARITGSDHIGPAAQLVPRLSGYGPRLDAAAFSLGNRRRVPFAEFAIGAATSDKQHDADVLYRAAAIIDPNAAQLSGVLDLLAAKHRDRLASEVTAARATQADPGATAYTLAVLVERAMELAAVRSGTARLTYSWQAGVELVDARTGGALDLGTLANAACAGPVAEISEVRTRLAGLGVDEAKGQPSGAEAQPELLAAMSGVTVNGGPYDLLILDTGLVLIPAARYDQSQERLLYLVARLGTMLSDQGWLVPYADIRTATMLHRSRANVLFTLRDQTFIRIEENTGSGPTAPGRDAARALLRDVAAGVRASGFSADAVGGPARGAALPVPSAETDRAWADAQRTWQARSRTTMGMIFLVPGTLLGIIAYATGPQDHPRLFGSAIAFAGAGVVFLILGAAGWLGPGTAFVGFGLLIMTLFITVGMVAGTALTLLPAVFGALLVGLGLARRHGRFPVRTGNGWLIAAAALALVGLLVVEVGQQRGSVNWAAAGMFLGPAVLLLIVGTVLVVKTAGSTRRNAPWYALGANRRGERLRPGRAGLPGGLSSGHRPGTPVGPGGTQGRQTTTCDRHRGDRRLATRLRRRSHRSVNESRG